jgi:hypothetical protein
MPRSLRSLLVLLIALVSGTLDARASVRLFVNSGTADLQELNPVTGAVISTTTITGWSGIMAAFAYDALTDSIFVSNTMGQNLWRIDYHTGVATVVGPYNLGAMDFIHGLAIDDTGQIFGLSSGSAVSSVSRFFSINRTTGAATLIAVPIPAGPGSLEFVAATQTMYLASTISDALYTIDRVTGATTLVGPFGVASQVGVGLAYNPIFGMYAVNNSLAIGLYKIDLQTGAATVITSMTGNPIALTFVDNSTPSTSFCAGNFVGTTCVACGNNGAAGRGCANSSFANGALLESSGVASLAGDTLVLTARDIPGPGLFFQADGVTGTPFTFGDGMLCATSGIIRLGVVFPTSGVASYPGGLTPNPISVAGAPIVANDVKHYQCWYRDAAVFCSTDTYNLTQGLTLTWTP